MPLGSGELMEEKVKSRTPTETLMEAMECFGENEPREVIIIYTTQNGDLIWNSSTGTNSTKLGMIEAAKFWILEHMRTGE